jgi:hypothetical protein
MERAFRLAASPALNMAAIHGVFSVPMLMTSDRGHFFDFFLCVGHDRRCAYRQQCIGGGVHDHVVRYVVDYRGFRAYALNVGPDPISSVTVILHIHDCCGNRQSGATPVNRVSRNELGSSQRDCRYAARARA